jgi:hypothetical protein
MKKLTTEKFIEKSKYLHGNVYDYSRVHYRNNKTNVIISCKIHGLFKQLPKNHLVGSGCKKCYTDRIQEKSRGRFIKEAMDVHGKYDYSKVNFIDMDTNVVIICKKHGEFQITPKNHLLGRGCPLDKWDF